MVTLATPESQMNTLQGVLPLRQCPVRAQEYRRYHRHLRVTKLNSFEIPSPEALPD